jgi:antitoxin HicB
MFRYRIIVEWSDEDAAFVARVPALLGCIAHGSTPERAAREVERAAEAMLAVMKEDGDTPPVSDASADYSGQLRLRLPRSLHGQLTQLASAEDVSLNSLLLTLLAEATGARLKVLAGLVRSKATRAPHRPKAKGSAQPRPRRSAAGHGRGSHASS